MQKDLMHSEAAPERIKPKGEFANRIPRCLVQWMYPTAERMTQWSYVEVDADKKRVKAIYFDDRSFWGKIPFPVCQFSHEQRQAV
jgi:hypothetical protein